MAPCGNFRRFFLLSMVLTGIVLSCLSTKSCEFLTLPGDHSETVGDTLGLHAFADPVTSECVAYGNSFSWDNSENISQKASLAAPVMASMALLILLIESFCCNFWCSRTFLSMFLLAAIFSQGLTFAFFNSNQFCGGRIIDEILHQDPCEPGQGSILSIAALLVFFFCNVLNACTPKRVFNKKESVEKESEMTDSGSDEEDGVMT